MASNRRIKTGDRFAVGIVSWIALTDETKQGTLLVLNGSGDVRYVIIDKASRRQLRWIGARNAHR